MNNIFLGNKYFLLLPCAQNLIFRDMNPMGSPGILVEKHK